MSRIRPEVRSLILGPFKAEFMTENATLLENVLEALLRLSISKKMEGFKAELKAYLDNPIGNDYMSLIGHDKQGTETDKEAARLDAKTTGRDRGYRAERARNAGTGRDWHKRAGLSVSLAGCRGGGY